jgi:glutamyl/glutaminyl-tRNA synthetase
MCLVNEYEARQQGGVMHLVFDDLQIHWTRFRSSPEEMNRYADRIYDDLVWMNIPMGEVIRTTDILPVVREKLSRIFGYVEPPQRTGYHPGIDSPTVVGMLDAPYPYTPGMVPTKVFIDFMLKVSKLIRGVDLITEFSLYEHWVHWFNLPRVRHVYLPRLICVDEPGGPVVPIAKTHKNLTVRGLREMGLTPALIEDLLKCACLKDVDGPWSVDNIREVPVVVLP